MAQRTSTPRSFELIEAVLNRSVARLVLAALIVLSILPFTWTPTLERILLPIFGLEFSLRLFVLWRTRKLTRQEVLLLTADAGATPPIIPFALRLGPKHASPGLVLNPKPDDSEILFRPSEVEALYAAGETEGFDRGER